MSVKLLATIKNKWMKVEHVQHFFNKMEEVKIVQFFEIHSIQFLHFY